MSIDPRAHLLRPTATATATATPTSDTGHPPDATGARIALAALVSLAIAMGIGRFAFTPLLPMMLRDRALGLADAGALASANYVGYLAGALLCTFQPWLTARFRLTERSSPTWIRGGLVATGTLTAAMALPWPPLWPVLRFLAGIASAIVFVHCSGWCLGQLARRGTPTLGGVMYAGPGIGIAATGLLTVPMVRWHWPAGAGWAFDGLLAFALAASVWRVIRVDGAVSTSNSPPTPTPTPTPTPAPVARTAPPGEIGVLALAYGLAGFGYIITATFLPVIARATLPDTPWLDLFWPIFGFGVATGALAASRWHTTADRRRLLAACYAVQAAGIAWPLLAPSLGGYAIGSFLTGLPFTVLTFYAMQEVRRLRPGQVSSTIGVLTATYGLGQIVGPLLAAALLRHAATPALGFAHGLEIAIGALLLGAALYLAAAGRWPLATARAG